MLSIHKFATKITRCSFPGILNEIFEDYIYFNTNDNNNNICCDISDRFKILPNLYTAYDNTHVKENNNNTFIETTGNNSFTLLTNTNLDDDSINFIAYILDKTISEKHVTYGYILYIFLLYVFNRVVKYDSSIGDYHPEDINRFDEPRSPTLVDLFTFSLCKYINYVNINKTNFDDFNLLKYDMSNECSYNDNISFKNDIFTDAQLETIFKMEHIEYNKFNDCHKMEMRFNSYSDTSFTYNVIINPIYVQLNIGILSNIPGSGKTRCALAVAIANKTRLNKESTNYSPIARNIIKSTDGDYCMNYYNVHNKENITDDRILAGTLIVVPSSVFMQWINEFNNINNTYKLNTTFKAYKTIRNFNKIDSDITLVTTNLFNKYNDMFVKYKFDRVIYDEADTVNVKYYNNTISANMVWFVSATINLYHIISKFNDNVYNIRKFDHIPTITSNIVNVHDSSYNNIQYIKFKQYVNFYNINSYTNLLRNEINSYVSDSIYEYIESGDIMSIKLHTQYDMKNVSVIDIAYVSILSKLNEIDNAVYNRINIHNNKIKEDIDNLKRLIDKTITVDEFIKLNNNNTKNIRKILGSFESESKIYEYIYKLRKEIISHDKIPLHTSTFITDNENNKLIEYNHVLKKLDDKIDDKLNFKLDECIICKCDLDESSVITACCQTIMHDECVKMYNDSTNSGRCILCRLSNCRYFKFTETILFKRYNERNPDCFIKSDYKNVNIITNNINKISKMTKLLNIINDNRKVIIYATAGNESNFISTLIDENIKFKILKGNVFERYNIINNFNNGIINVIVLLNHSNVAGVNLTSATDLVIYNNINDSLLLQIIGRVDRYGLDHPVDIHLMEKTNLDCTMYNNHSLQTINIELDE